MVAKDSTHRSSGGQKQDRKDCTAAQDRGWMPSSLQGPFLCSLAALFLLLSIVLECLRQYSDRNQGLVVFKTTAELPTSVSLAYIYIPTAVAVLAVTLWNFTSSDVVRLEPYFQLAKPGGVAAAVLFTSYSFYYGPMAPLMAARNRHWLVFFTSGLSILLRIFLPSLLSGLLVLAEVTTTESKSVRTWPDLLDLDTQKSWLSSETFAHHANASVKMTVDDLFLLRSPDYATAAVSMPLDENDTSLLSLNQTVYWAEFACQEVTLTDLKTPDRGGFWNISGIEFPSLGDGNAASTCYVDISLGNITANWGTSSQVRYWEPVHSETRFHSASVFRTRGCQPVALFGTLLDLDIDVHGISKSVTNATAFACTPTYLSAEAELFISVNGSITEAKVHPSTERSLTSTGFAHEEFQDLLFFEYHSNPLAKLRTPNAVAADGIDLWPVAANVTTRIDVAQYQDAIIQFWRQKFVTTMSKFFNPTATPTKVDARQVTRVVALAVISRTALMAETILLAAVVLLLLLAAIYPRRLNFLRGDPGSIAAQCGIIADLFPYDTVLARPDAQFHSATTRQLGLWSKGFRCEWTGEPSKRKINIVPLNRTLGSECLALPATRRGRDPRPHFLVPHWFLVECVLLFGILVTFGFALSSLRVNDVNDVSSREVALTIFLIYAPTVVSSVISSLLASILRHLSVLEPWVRLQRGMASATDSLELNYGSQTPIAVLRKGGRGAPLLLTILSITCVLDLLLNVVSGGIFEPRLKQHRTPATGLLSAQYNDTVMHVPSFEAEFDGYGLILSSLTTGAALLPWTTPDYSFLPLTVNDFNESDYDSLGGVGYSAITLGVGANLECHHVPIDNSWIDSETYKVFWNDTTSGHNCTAEVGNGDADGGLIRRSIKYILPSGDSPASPCQTSIFILARWATRNPAPMTSQNSMALYCTPSIQINEFEVLVDGQGTIASYKHAAATTDPRGQMLRNASENLGYFNRALASIGQKLPAHRHSSFYQYDWPGLLTSFAYEPLDPTLDSFQPEFLIRAVQSTYRAIFSSYLTLAREIYFDSYRYPATPMLDGTIVTKLWGVMPSTPSMVIVIVLLSIDISVLILVFALRRNHFDGPRIPKSIGSLIPWVTRSRIAPDFRGTSRMMDSERRDYLVQRSHKYSFGLSLCPDGEERWLLDYDSRYLKEEDHELEEICETGMISRCQSGDLT